MEQKSVIVEVSNDVGTSSCDLFDVYASGMSKLISLQLVVW